MPQKTEMPFHQHLEDLRNCLAKSLLAIFLCAIASFVWADELFTFLTEPLSEGFANHKFIGTGPAEAFMVKLKVALVAGLVVSAPHTFYQIWRFISPGLYRKERGFALPFVFFSSFCFFAGVSFCFKVVLPFVFEFFSAEFADIGVEPTLRIGEALTFTVKLLVIFGTVFELPVLSYFLARMGLLTHTWLINKARFGIIGVFILAAILTPPDPISQMLLAVPLIIIYGLCIAVAYSVATKKNDKITAEEKP